MAKEVDYLCLCFFIISQLMVIVDCKLAQEIFDFNFFA